MTGKRILSIILIMVMVLGATANFDAATRPSKVKNIRITKITKHTANLKWNKSKNASYYQVYRIVKTYRSHGKVKYKYKKIKNVRKNKCTIRKMKVGKRYKFRIRAVYKHKKGKLSNIKVIKTSAKARKVKKRTSSISRKSKIKQLDSKDLKR